VADGTNNAHHSEILGITGGTPIGDQCLWCHVNVVDVLGIRGCETCHSVRSLHNVQYDFANTSTLRGYGHIGSNNPADPANHSWDCKGCHAWYDAGSSDNPFAGAVVPDVHSVTPSVFNANTPTVVTLTGTNFVQDGSITVVNIDDTTNLTPATITNGQITVTVNLAAGAHYIKVVKTDAVENVPKPSDIKPLTVVPVVTLSSASLSGTTLTISGTGLGNMPATTPEQYVVVGSAGYAASITSWSDTQIVATVSGPVAAGDVATVITAGAGEAKATVSIATPASITVTSPNGGESWRRGSTHAITWTKAGSSQAANVKIELLRGTSATTIKSSTPNTGTYSWRISSSQTIASNYKIRITSIGTTPLYSESSDSTFSITR
jgi:hypothetical protein